MSNPGDLDTTFGTNGLVTTNVGDYFSSINSIVLQSDGKIIAGGNYIVNDNYDNYFALARYNSDGTLDTSFGTNGLVSTDISINNVAQSVVLQSDGKIIAGGYTGPGGYAGNVFVLARYNTNGSLDTSFGTNGKVTTDFSTSAIAYSVKLQSDGKIIACGAAGNAFALVRYNSDGTLDTSFGTNGKVTTDITYDTDTISSIVLQSDGKIIACGYTNNVEGSYTYDFALARYNSDGTLDTSFGTNGMVTTDFNSGMDIIYSIVLQSDGKIIAGGRAEIDSAPYDFALARYNSDGTLDTSFGTNGKVTTDITYDTDTISSIVLQSDGKIIACGYTNNVEGSYTYDFALARYNSDGTLDTSFGTNGIVTTDFGETNDFAYSIVLQSDGKIVAAGYSNASFALARYIGDTLPVVPICFPAGTPIETDQGSIAIEKIDSKINTIRGKKIVAITKTVTIEDTIICIEKDALDLNIPSQKTFISRNHKLLYNKQMVKAKNLVGEVEGVYNKKYNGEILYNVLLETCENMIVNNLIVETLHPENIVAKLYNGSHNAEEKNNIIVHINKCANDYKRVYGKLI